MQKGKIDYLLLIAVVFLTVVGLTFIYTASSAKAAEKFGDSAYFLKRQLVRVVLGLVAMALIMRVDYHRIVKHAPWIFWPALTILLFLLFAPESWSVRGTRRWISLMGVQFQPSELAKYALIFMLTRVLTLPGIDMKKFTDGVLPQLILTAMVCGTVLLEPDASTALMIFFIALMILFAAGAKAVHLFNVLMAGLLITVVTLMMNSYQRSRILSFISSLGNENELGWQVRQSLISLGSGGFFGVGLGQSQQKMHWLPDPFTDFIFSIIGEELGFLGTLTVLLMFVLIIYRGFRIALNAPDTEGQLLAVGITGTIGLYAFVNMAVITHLVPTTGIPMPFISYGGSSLVTTLAATGILLNISYQGSLKFARTRVGSRHARRSKKSFFGL